MNRDIRQLANAYRLITERADPSKVDTQNLFKPRLSQIDQTAAKALANNNEPQDNDQISSRKPFQSVASKLLPGQSSMDLDKFIGMAISMAGRMKGFENGPGGDLGAIISSDSRLMDGHHRWAATLLINPNTQLAGMQIDMPYQQLLGVLNVWTKAHGRSGKPATVKLSSITPDMVYNRFKEMAVAGNKFITADQIKQAFATQKTDAERLATAARQNWTSIQPTWGNTDELPDKVDMPAIEPDELPDVKADLEQGKLDVNPPYSPAVSKMVPSQSKQ